MGFQRPTPVQASTIPLFLQHKDVVVEAVTGSGKTLAFTIPIVEILAQRKPKLALHQIGALVLSPTRELAQQIGACMRALEIEKLGLSLSVFMGGTDVEEELASFLQHGGNIIVATPGRLEDLLTRYGDSHLRMALKSLEVLVLDEADRLLDLGFERSIRAILTKLPKQRRTGLFSATMTDTVAELVRAGLRNPVKVTVKVHGIDQQEQRTPESLKIYYKLCPYPKRLGFILKHILQANPNGKTIVYLATCACVDYFYKLALALCQKSKVPSLFALHGKMETKRRNLVYKHFSSISSGAILLCTDLAARGLDFENVELVIQMDPPQDPATFSHRCGRTARCGRAGTALLLLEAHEEPYVDLLNNRKIPITELSEEVVELEGLDDLEEFGLAEVKRANISDRELYEKSIKAFVSYIRFYQEHLAKFIFCLKNLDIGALANSFGLIKMPKMPELKQVKVAGFVPDNSIKTEMIVYKNKAMEKQRQVGLDKKARSEEGNPRSSHQKAVTRPVAWSENKARKQRRDERKVKRLNRQKGKLQDKAENNPIEGSFQKCEAVDLESQDDTLDTDWAEYRKEKRLKRKHGQQADLLADAGNLDNLVEPLLDSP